MDFATCFAQDGGWRWLACATAVTHLFNAMSQLRSRAPGVVGAVLADPRVFCGLIADGEHAHPGAYRAAIAAKGAGGVALVSDAMPPAAGGPAVFELQGRRMTRVGRKLVAEDGTLAGAAITMRDAVAYVVNDLGLPLADGLTMATLTPASLIGSDDRIGRLAPGCRADLVPGAERWRSARRTERLSARPLAHRPPGRRRTRHRRAREPARPGEGRPGSGRARNARPDRRVGKSVAARRCASASQKPASRVGLSKGRFHGRPHARAGAGASGRTHEGGATAQEYF